MTLPGEPLLRLYAPYAREKGMVAWRPTHGTREAEILPQILALLEQYRDHLPLGNRTITYLLLPRWIARYPDKNDLLKNMVTPVLTKARRAGLIPFESIDDQRTASDRPFTSRSLPGLVEDMQIDRQAGQPFRIEVWVETKGNVTRLANLCRAYGVEVFSGSGSVPIRANRQTAVRIMDARQPTLLLVLTDFDPSGLKSIAAALHDDVRAFVRSFGGDPNERVVIRHLGITAAMAAALPVESREPIKNPPNDWPLPYKVELEALPPDQLDALVLDALASVRDEAMYQTAMAAETDGRIRALEELALTLKNGGAAD